MEYVLYLLILILLTSASGLIYMIIKFRKEHKKFITVKEKALSYESICQQANDAVLVIDIVNGNIQKANNKAAEMLGYTKDELEKLTIFNIHPPDLLNKSSEIIADVWEKKGLIYQDLPFKKSNGELLPVECSAKVLPIDSKPSIVIYARDITERLRMEKEIKLQKELIEQKNKDITDSINYAQRIQRAILPEKDEIIKAFSDSFILYNPKDIVSGDFYYFGQVDDKYIYAAVDCTGHGVPGSLMSMMGKQLLDNIVLEKRITQPSEILNNLHRGVRASLGQYKEHVKAKDGMDISLCTIDYRNKKLHFSGANNSLLVFANGKLIEIKADRYGIGGEVIGKERTFTNHTIELEKGLTIYMVTDGYSDQFGGPKDKKFTSKRFRDILLNIQEFNMQQQMLTLDKEFTNWKGNYEQTDDILIIGIKFSQENPNL